MRVLKCKSIIIEFTTTSSMVVAVPNIHGSDNAVISGSIPDLYTLRYSITDAHSSAVTSIKISPDQTKFATCTSDSRINIFDISTGKLISTLIGHTKGISDIEFSPINSNILASCSDDLTIRLWSISKQKCIKILKKHTYHITTIKFTTKGNILISGAADETITIWDINSGKTLKTLAAHSDPVLSLCLTPDNTIIVSASYDGLMRLFDLETGQCLKTLTYNSTSHGTATASTNDVLNFPISNVEISPNGKYILSSSLDGLIRLWDYMDNKVIKTYMGIDGQPISEKFICGTKFVTKTVEPKIVSGSDSSGMLVWDVNSKQVVYRFKQTDAPVFEVDIADEGKLLVSCSEDGRVCVFDLDEKYCGTKNLENTRDDTPALSD